MTRLELNQYITENYSKLIQIADGLTKKHQRNYDPAILVAEAYEHCLNMIAQINNANQLQQFMIAKMRMEASYYQSKINRQNRCRHDNEITFEHIDEGVQPIDYMYNVAISYYNSETDPIARYIFEDYFFNEKHSCRLLGQYYNIDKMTANKLINELKFKIKQHEKVQG